MTVSVPYIPGADILSGDDLRLFEDDLVVDIGDQPTVLEQFEGDLGSAIHDTVMEELHTANDAAESRRRTIPADPRYGIERDTILIILPGKSDKNWNDAITLAQTGVAASENDADIVMIVPDATQPHKQAETFRKVSEVLDLKGDSEARIGIVPFKANNEDRTFLRAAAKVSGNLDKLIYPPSDTGRLFRPTGVIEEDLRAQSGILANELAKPR